MPMERHLTEEEALIVIRFLQTCLSQQVDAQFSISRTIIVINEHVTNSVKRNQIFFRPKCTTGH